MWKIHKEELLDKLQLICGVVGRKQTFPILSNILWEAKNGTIQITASDTEIELSTQMMLIEGGDEEKLTIPGKKLMEIVRSAPDECSIQMEVKENSVVVSYGKSRFTLLTLPAVQFPVIKPIFEHAEFTVQLGILQWLIERTHFSMADQDVRYYLNGMLLEIDQKLINCAASDGHRLSSAQHAIDCPVTGEFRSFLIPRKAVTELNRLLTDSSEIAKIYTGKGFLQLATETFTITTKLIESKIPHYQQLLPRESKLIVVLDREAFKQALIRTNILSDFPDHRVRLKLSSGALTVCANNSGQESAESEIPADYSGENFEIVFNALYLLDGISVLSKQNIRLLLNDPSSSMVIEETGTQNTACHRYMVMPICD